MMTRVLAHCLLATGTFAAALLAPVSCSEQKPADHDASHAHGIEEEAHHEAEEHDEHGEDGIVQLSAGQVAAAGIRTRPAGPEELAIRLTLPAVVTENIDAVTHVNPRAPGVIRAIAKHLGDAVAEGDLLCVIDSIPLGTAAAEYVRARALVAAAETTLEREARLFEERLATAERMLDGAVEVNRRIHEREKELQAQAVTTIRPLLEAEKALEASRLERDRDLTDLRAARDARLLEIQVGLTERRIMLDAARNVLLTLSVDGAKFDALEAGSPLLAGSYEIHAPRPGIVAGRHITVGEFVDAETKLYTLEDLSRVWILASAFEEQLRAVRTGQTGRVRLDAFPGRDFAGEVTQIGYDVDPESRALGVRLELENAPIPEWPERYPIRPGMFGAVDLVVESVMADVVVPESAVVHESSGDIVFVLTAPGTFEARAVEIGRPSGDLVEVLSGLQAGEAVVVTGAFHLKSAWRKGELGEGHSH